MCLLILVMPYGGSSWSVDYGIYSILVQYMYSNKLLQLNFSQASLSHTYPITMFCWLRRSTLQSASHCGGCAREQADHSVLLCEKSGCQTSFPSCSHQPGKTVH